MKGAFLLVLTAICLFSIIELSKVLTALSILCVSVLIAKLRAMFAASELNPPAKMSRELVTNAGIPPEDANFASRCQLGGYRLIRLGVPVR